MLSLAVLAILLFVFKVWNGYRKQRVISDKILFGRSLGSDELEFVCQFPLCFSLEDLRYVVRVHGITEGHLVLLRRALEVVPSQEGCVAEEIRALLQRPKIIFSV